MHDVEQMIRRRARDFERQGLPFIIYGHWSDGSCGMTAIQLGKYEINPKTCLSCWEGHKQDTLSTGFLRSLNKRLRETRFPKKRLAWKRPTVLVLADLYPLTPEDRERVLTLVPELSPGESEKG